MRIKIHEGHKNNSGLFDIKHDSGGMVDIEFIVQFIVLAYAASFAELAANSGNLALLALSAKLNLIDSELVVEVQNSYRKLRLIQHKMRLNGTGPCRIAATEIDVTVVLKLWKIFFPDS
jgi:glutamate-ammonia-ligase adenylyltransferase